MCKSVTAVALLWFVIYYDLHIENRGEIKMTKELKPCPFCGCDMEIQTVGRDWWRIKPVDGHDDTCPFGENHEWDCSQQKPEWKDEHVADWNKRA
ncbi:hypothetical protein NVP1047O_33 [Vibrio phage 1.047.O._10N.286.55.F2]|nr:hypothetical protein NVP1047O_33 [Vibrio phage 1.047.O._10N.286.55.F2]